MERYRYTQRRERPPASAAPQGGRRLAAPRPMADRVTGAAIGAALLGAGVGLLVLGFESFAGEGDLGSLCFPLLLGGWLASIAIVAGWGGWLAARSRRPAPAYGLAAFVHLVAIVASLAMVPYGHPGRLP
ncbi:hypothetical protein [Streptacidiphilus rugosus]|uniref:hypothetical protein n=1 Tax=Streptacidiphilus rugosus TaxID=405783 RepID=UPI00056688DB|nr:hypothetical protein [Streptacidiphilus rugosus]